MTGKAPAPDARGNSWRVYRIDDHGRRFEVAAGLSEAAAEQMIRDFEGKGHKQSYFKERPICADGRTSRP